MILNKKGVFMKTKKVLLTGLMFLLLLLTMPYTIMAAVKKPVYVITSVTQKSSYVKKETKLSYNKNGLLSKATIPSTSFGWLERQSEKGHRRRLYQNNNSHILLSIREVIEAYHCHQRCFE